MQMTAGRVERFPRISGESFTVWEERREERLSRLHDEGYYNFEMWPADMLAPDEWAVLYAASGEPAPRYLSGEQMAAENIRLRSDGCPTYMFATTEDAVMNLANDAAYLPGCTEEEYEQRVEQGVNHGEFVAGIDDSGTHSATFVRFTRGAGSGDEVYLTYGWGFWADTVAAETEAAAGGSTSTSRPPDRRARGTRRCINAARDWLHARRVVPVPNWNGHTLHLADDSPTGYRGVRSNGIGTAFEARCADTYLGSFETALLAAVAYAEYALANRITPCGPSGPAVGIPPCEETRDQFVPTAAEAAELAELGHADLKLWRRLEGPGSVANGGTGFVGVSKRRNRAGGNLYYQAIVTKPRRVQIASACRTPIQAAVKYALYVQGPPSAPPSPPSTPDTVHDPPALPPWRLAPRLRGLLLMLLPSLTACHPRDMCSGPAAAGAMGAPPARSSLHAGGGADAAHAAHLSGKEEGVGRRDAPWLGRRDAPWLPDAASFGGEDEGVPGGEDEGAPWTWLPDAASFGGEEEGALWARREAAAVSTVLLAALGAISAIRWLRQRAESRGRRHPGGLAWRGVPMRSLVLAMLVEHAAGANASPVGRGELDVLIAAAGGMAALLHALIAGLGLGAELRTMLAEAEPERAAGTPAASQTRGPSARSAGRSNRRRSAPSPPTTGASASETPLARRQAPREVAYWQMRTLQREAGARLALVSAETWSELSLRCRTGRWAERARRRSAHRAHVLLRLRLTMLPKCRRFCTALREQASRRRETLALLRTPPRPIRRDVGYSELTRRFSFRDAHGAVSYVHPAAAADDRVPAYSAEGDVVTPMWPPRESSYVLCPERRGGWCYYDTEQGNATWHAPDGSEELSTREVKAVDLPSDPPPCLPPWLGLGTLRHTDWLLLRSDADNRLLLWSKVTGAVREAPWVSLLSTTGVVYFANLITQETRYLPPHRWMDGWVARAPHEPMELSSSCGAWPLPYLPGRKFDDRDALPQSFARRRVDGGAPYLLDAGAGVPQYAPDQYDTSLTYPGWCDSSPGTGIGGTTTPGPDTLTALGIVSHTTLGPPRAAQPAAEGGARSEPEGLPSSEQACNVDRAARWRGSLVVQRAWRCRSGGWARRAYREHAGVLGSASVGREADDETPLAPESGPAVVARAAIVVQRTWVAHAYGPRLESGDGPPFRFLVRLAYTTGRVHVH